MKSIDASVILTFLTNTPPDKARRCEELFKRVANKEERVYIPFVEVYRFVEELENRLQESKNEIIALLRELFYLRGVEFGSRKFLKETFRIYQETELNFKDSVLMASMEKKGLEHMYSCNGSPLKSYLKIFEP